MPYTFTPEQRKKGGKNSAKQAALRRITTPTKAEKKVRKAVAILRVQAEYEKPIQTAPDIEQYLDIYFERDGRRFAVEVDGSNGWHDQPKMAPYDRLKGDWCTAHDVRLVLVTCSIWRRPIKEIAEFIRSQIE